MTLNRRNMLRLTGAAAVAALVGSARRPAAASPNADAGAAPSCIVRPEQTEGPYFVDTQLNRSDIRSDSSGGALRPGAPLHLAVRVSQITGDRCAPLPGAMVDIWQCDALGVYSGVKDMNELFETSGKKFLRGYQLTDAQGVVRFVTIYPGWYEGRAVHVHFKIRTNPSGRRRQEFTSQLYFDESLTDAVHAEEPYASKGRRDTPNAKDGIFRRGGKDLLLDLVRTDQSYQGTFDIGLRAP